jgi:major membrane immunogen (membrane-anchored lipoprotein)
MSQFNIGESFQAMSLLKAIAPIANVIQGKLNSNIKISGQLNNDFTPNLATLSGDILAQLLSTKVSSDKAPLLNMLQGQLKFLDFNKLDLNDIKTAIQFKDGKIAIRPFDLKYEDINIKVGGSHGLDNSMDYKATFQVPAKYLGKEAGNLVAQLNEQELKDVTVPLNATLGGSFLKPKVNTDLKAAVKDLTSQLVQKQKNKLLKQGSDKAEELIGGLLGGNKTKDSTKSKSNDAVKDTAKKLLGGLFGGKKKKDTVQ